MATSAGKPVTRVNWGTVATFDAWYGYQAMLVSVMNPIVSGGTAAFASGLAAVFLKIFLL